MGAINVNQRMSFSLKFKSNPDKRNPKLVRIEMVLYKSDYTRISKSVKIQGNADDWDANNECFKENSSENISKNIQLKELRLKYIRVVEEWEREKEDWTPLQWSHHFEAPKKKKKAITKVSVSQFIESLITRFRTTERVKNGHVITGSGNGDLYVTLRNSLAEFTKKVYQKSFHTFYFEDLDEKFWKDYALYLEKRGIEMGNNGGIVNRLKSLKAAVNHAFKARIPDVDPTAYICVAKKMINKPTTTKAVPEEVVRAIEVLDRSNYTDKQKFHIDLFLFSYYAGGMCNTDVCNLRYSSISEGSFLYERMKTYKNAKMPVLLKALEIIKKYEGQGIEDFVFPVFSLKHKTSDQKRRRVSKMSDAVRITLKKVSKDIGYNKKITWNSARGTYITKALKMNFDIDVVAQQAGNSPAVIYKHYVLTQQTSELIDTMNQSFCFM